MSGTVNPLGGQGPLMALQNPSGTPASPGASSGIVPGGGPNPTAEADQATEQSRRMLALLSQALQQSQRPRIAAQQPVVPGGQAPVNPTPPAYMTDRPYAKAWAPERFMYSLQNTLQNVASAKQQRDVAHATNQYNYLLTALDKYVGPDGQIDPKAYNDPGVMSILGNPKELKAMSKAMQIDWLNPKPTTPYQQGMSAAIQKRQKQQQARTGLDKLFHGLVDKVRQPTPQLTPEQQKQMAQEVGAKAPISGPNMNAQDAQSVARSMLDIDNAAKAMRENYQYIPGYDGSVWAVNKTNPKDAHQLKDAVTGEDVKGKSPAKEDTPLMANGIPVAVYHNGRPVFPGDAEFSERDGKILDAGKDAAKEKQFLRIDPIIAAQIGEPPNPAEYKKGRSDPAYGEALKKYGLQAETIKDRMAASSGEGRAKAFAQYRVIEGLDYDAQGNPVNRYMYAKDAVENGFGSASQGAKNMSRTQQIADIEFSSKQLRDAVTNIDKPFSAGQIAKLQVALETPDDTIASAEMQAVANSALTDKQQDFVIWVKHLNERAMSLRNIAGQGQGAQDTRNAIRALLPGPATNPKMMGKMLDAFDNQVRILKSGIPKPGGSTVLMKSPGPNGKTQEVPRDQVEHFKTLGATVVQNAPARPN